MRAPPRSTFRHLPPPHPPYSSSSLTKYFLSVSDMLICWAFAKQRVMDARHPLGLPVHRVPNFFSSLLAAAAGAFCNHAGNKPSPCGCFSTSGLLERSFSTFRHQDCFGRNLTRARLSVRFDAIWNYIMFTTILNCYCLFWNQFDLASPGE